MKPFDRHSLALGAIALLLAAVAWSPTLSFDFTWDDHPLIADNDQVQRGLSEAPAIFLSNFWDLGERSDSFRQFYRPLVTLSYLLGWSASPGRPFGFHLGNLLLHLACTALAFALAHR